MEIIPNVHQIKDVVVNLYLIAEPDGLTLIDAGFGKDARKILAYMAEMRRQPQELRRILITHCDGDHVGGVAALKAKTGARVYASSLEAQAMASGVASRPMQQSGPLSILMSRLDFLFKFTPAQADETLSAGQVLPVLGGLQVIATPGHTPEHVSLFAPQYGILFCGDSMTSSRGRLQRSGGPATWDADQALESVRRQAALGAKVVCSGHGPVVIDVAGKFPI
jgi:glyoxylase-like metal-dependent hydrolase (beta-lactamase superfamily II)